MYLNTHIKGPGQPPGSPALSTFPSISPGTAAPHPRPGEGPVRAGGQRGASTPPPHFGGGSAPTAPTQPDRSRGGLTGPHAAFWKGLGSPRCSVPLGGLGPRGCSPRHRHVRALRARRNPRIPSDLQPRGVFFLLFSARILPGPHGEPKDSTPGGSWWFLSSARSELRRRLPQTPAGPRTRPPAPAPRRLPPA